MLLDALKDLTRPDHQRLEQLNPLPATVPAYVAQLEAFFGFIEPWERHLRTQLSTPPALRLRAVKTLWLAEDLEHFGSTPAQRAQLPRCDPWLEEVDPLAQLGVAYVLEGATLGGQIVSRHLESNLGLKDGRGYRYAQSYGPDVGRKWQEFRAYLVQHSSAQNDPKILGAARMTFQALATWFGRRAVVLA